MDKERQTYNKFKALSMPNVIKRFSDAAFCYCVQNAKNYLINVTTPSFFTNWGIHIDFIDSK